MILSLRSRARTALQSLVVTGASLPRSIFFWIDTADTPDYKYATFASYIVLVPAWVAQVAEMANHRGEN